MAALQDHPIAHDSFVEKSTEIYTEQAEDINAALPDPDEGKTDEERLAIVCCAPILAPR
jgi:hypothetical protein